MNQQAKTVRLIKAIAFFDAAARKGSFRAAALETGVDHLTVSRQVRNLEAHLGVQLFIVQKQKLRLTSQGESFLRAIGPTLSKITKTIEEHTTGTTKAPLRIACEPGFLGCWLMPRMGSLRRRLPNIDFVFLPVSSTLANIDSNTDLSIVFTDRLLQEDIVLHRPAAIAVCNTDVFRGFGGFLEIESLFEAPLLHDDSETYWDWWFSVLGVNYDAIAPSQSLQFLDAKLAMEAAREGMGVALANSLIAVDDLKSGKLSRARPEAILAETYVVRINNSYRRRDALKVVSWIKAMIRIEFPHAGPLQGAIDSDMI